MNPRHAARLVCVLLIVTAAGCTGADGPRRSPGVVTIRASVGKEFTLTLASNRTTGYGWQLSRPPDKAVAQFVSSEYAAPHATKAVGAPGRELWKFRAAGRGATPIELVYVRAWEQGVAPAEEARYNVIVK